MKNKLNMTQTHQQINLHHKSQNNQINHGSDKQPQSANACKPAKVNSIDNQRLIYQNT